MRFSSASRPRAFIDYLGTRPRTLPRAQCLYLEVRNLWDVEDTFMSSSPQEAINPEILESLQELFSDTITTLDLKFIEFFALPSRPLDESKAWFIFSFIRAILHTPLIQN
ncbi:hypothetical protein PCANC_08502 [Puccinia coronata f. sp. avenae]|uniref:Uncharacterized protein n=1 Tax=Puccinia coronata f. sp. avenae TaxID=200324 RepID=A0A2N5V9F8_9BASI|nr:hypothetical protein PCANC_08502 [Puccinia coronata f. sp. avenae]